MHLPVKLLRWRFGPQPPSANAGVTTDDRAVERMTIPSSVAEDFFTKHLPFTCDNRAEPQPPMLGPPNTVLSDPILGSDNLNPA